MMETEMETITILSYIGIMDKNMETITILSLYRDNGKDNGKCYNGVLWG